MSLTLKPYSEYKESGLHWLGRVPAHWKRGRVKNLLQESDKRSGSGMGVLLSLTRAHGLIPQSTASVKLASAADLSKYKVCVPGQLVMNRMQAWSGMFACARIKGLVSPDYSVFTTLRDCDVSYFEYLFRSPLYIERFALNSKGIGSGFNRLYTPDFGSIHVEMPPLDEQTQIARFVRNLSGLIQKLIRAKRRVIELLNEQKQAIIHRAVTRGLDPTVRLTASGIEWLGDVPAHWKTNPAKYSIYEVDERSTTGTEELLSVSHITGVSPRSQKNITMFMASSYVGHKICHPGDLVVNTMWAWMGALGVSGLIGIVSPSYAVYRLSDPDSFIPGYLDRLLRTRPYISEFICRSTGIRSSRLRLYPEQLLKIPLLQPPRDEQELIVKAVERETADIEKSIEIARREIDLVREYRTRLIADVVTGKLDVRRVELPGIDGEEPFDELTESEDAEAVSDEELNDAEETEDVAN